MNLSLLSTLIALTLFGPAFAAPTLLQRGDATTDLVTRTYDLRAANPLLDEDEGESAMHLAPYLRTSDDGSQFVFRRDTFDDVASVVLQAFEAEFQFEGRAFDLLDGQRVRVTAPAATHKEVAALIQFLEQGFRRSVTLRVDWIDRPADAALAQPLLPIAEADKLVAAATQPRRSTLTVQPGRAASFAAQRSYEVVMDYDVEIAQASTIADPVVGSFQVGVNGSLRAAATIGGVWIAAGLSDGAVARPPRRIDIDVGALIVTERGSERISSLASVESLSVLRGSYALSLYLPDGQAAVIDLGVNLRTGARRGALILRREGTTPEPLSTFALRGSKARLELIDSSWYLPPTLEYGGSLDALPAPQQLLTWWTDYEDSVLLASVDPWELAAEFDDGSRAVTNVGPWLLVHTEQAGVSALAGAPQLANPPPPEHAGVWFHLRRGGQTVAQWSLPLASGRTQHFALGGETWAVLEADVEVAQSAATMDPVLRSRLDGVLGAVTGSRSQDGAWSLDLSLLAHILSAEPTPTPAGSMLHLDIDRNEYDDLLLDDRLVLGGPLGVRARTLGMSGALELDVELR